MGQHHSPANRLARYAACAALLALTMPAAAASQPETVTVQADNLPGLWKIGIPSWVYRAGMEVKFGPVQDDFCRMDGPRHDVHVYCYIRPMGAEDEGDVTLDGDHMHVAFGTMMMRAVLDATQGSPGIFTGDFAIKFAGIPIHPRAAYPLTARKIEPSKNTYDAGGDSTLLAKLLKDIAEGAQIQSLAQLQKGQAPPAADALRKLGAVQSVIYLGRTPTSMEQLAARKDWPGSKDRWPTKPLPNDDAQFIYAVEFSNGERVCGMRQRPDAVVDVLRCV